MFVLDVELGVEAALRGLAIRLLESAPLIVRPARLNRDAIAVLTRAATAVTARVRHLEVRGGDAVSGSKSLQSF